MAGDLDALFAELAELVGEYRGAQARARAVDDNFRCDACTECRGCRFCTGCERCSECTQCEGCVECSGCTKCRRCRGCAQSSLLEYCRGCERGQNLLLCLECVDCSYCIACVGLTGEEHCILNKRYARKDFFQLQKALKAHLDGLPADEAAALFLAAESPAQSQRFVLDALRQVRGKARPGDAAELPTPAPVEEASPWLDEALPQVQRVDGEGAPEGPPAPRIGVVRWGEG
ncbi:MAG: hypothetical protein R3B09_24465 [Nannocystaceae bacterium]